MLERLYPSQQGQRISFIGITLCFLFAIGGVHFQTIGKVAEALLVFIGFWCLYRYSRGIALQTPIRLLLIAIAIPLISWALGHLSQPEWIKEAPQLEKIARIFLFLPLAWFLKDKIRYIFYFWSISALLILLSPWLSGSGWQEILSVFQGNRIDFGLRNAQHTSLFFGFVFIGLVSFLPRLLRYHKLSLLIWLPSTLLCAITLIGTQTRAAWIALIVAGVISLIYLATNLAHHSIHLRKRWLAVAGLSMLFTGILLQHLLGPIVLERLERENQVLSQIINLNFDNIPYTSIGIRINSWKAGIEHISERPFTGWGDKGQEIAIERTAWLPDRVKKHFGHMHNIYIALLLQYGILGFLFYAIWIGWLLVSVLRQVSKKQLDLDIGHFTLASFSFWSVISLTESYLFFWTGVVCLQTLFAGLLAFMWHNQTTKMDIK